MEKEEQKKVQEKYILLQLIALQIKETEKELAALEQKNLELLNLIDSLSNLEKSKPNSKGFSHLGSGVFVESAIRNTKEVVVNVGADILSKKTIPETKKLLQEQTRQTETLLLQLAQNLENLSARAQELQKEIQALAK
jgi:prefoldin alpha subunit